MNTTYLDELKKEANGQLLRLEKCPINNTNPSCDCHKAHHKDNWEEELNELAEQYKGQLLGNVLNPIAALITRTRTAAHDEGVREALAALPANLNENVRTSRGSFSAESEMNRMWNAAIEEARTALTALLQVKDGI